MSFCSRFFSFAILILCITIDQTVLAQDLNRRVSYTEKNAPLRKVLDAIVKQAGCSYVYGEDDGMLDNLVTLNVHEVPLKTVLDALLQNFPLTYTVTGPLILIKRKAAVPGASPSADPYIVVSGEVTDEDGEPIPSATVTVAGSSKNCYTDSRGHFKLSVKKGAIIVISNVSMQTQQVQILGQNQGQVLLNIRLKSNSSWMRQVSVIGKANNGYTKTHKLRAIGSFDLIDRTLIERSSSPYVNDRIENLSPGLLINHGGQAADGSALPNVIFIRGLSTINGNPQPLQIVDNFIYDGDIHNINPSDIENITIMKDAAATAIWGARAGNGVIVITTKKGSTPTPKLSFQSTVSFQQRPDVFNMRTISSSDFIANERALFKNGYYNGYVNGIGTGYISITPVVALLQAVQDGQISSTAADNSIASMEKHDVRDDISGYFYRNSISQQYALQVSGSAAATNYYFSLNWDRDPSTLAAQGYDRISLRSQNSFKISNRFQLDAGINLTQGLSQNGSNPGYQFQSLHNNRSFYPYARFADDQGRPQYLSMDYNPAYLSQTTALGFGDWRYNPIKDIATEKNRVKTRDVLFNTGMQYNIAPYLNAELRYQFENQLISGKNAWSDSSWYARDLVNSFVQVSPTGNSLSYPVPAGGILNIDDKELTSHQGRIQLNYHRSWESMHELTAMAGFEVRSLVNRENTNRYYGYEENVSTIYPSVDYTGSYTQYGMSQSNGIPNLQAVSRYTDNTLSAYANFNYLYHKRYALFLSARKDQANLFAVSNNQNKAPLWSAGLSWQVDNEPFYQLSWLPFLKLKASYGSSGNLARLGGAYTTASYSQSSLTGSSYRTAVIQSLPNKNFRWEEVRMLNAGIEFGTRQNTISGAIEFYSKHARDLMAETPMDPTLGLTRTDGTPSFYYGNTAAMHGSGIDLQLETHNLRGKFGWTTNFIFSHTSSKVTKYLPPVRTGSNYVQQNAINPVIGRPLYALYSYKWMGLDPQTGNPMGYYQGKSSAEYSTIITSTMLDSMVYSGPAQPTSFGALRNTFTFGRLSASFNISYRFGYYFRKPSISYSGLFTRWTGSADYAARWQQPGDERHTDVPSPGLPDDYVRDKFYLNSSALVRKADNIRLEDINLSYELDKQRYPRLPFQRVRIFTYISNFGILWKANKDGIDPYYINVPKERKKISFGLNVQF